MATVVAVNVTVVAVVGGIVADAAAAVTAGVAEADAAV